MTKLFVTPVAATDDKPKKPGGEESEKKGAESIFSVQPHTLPLSVLPQTTIVNKPRKCRMSWLVCLIILLWLSASLIIVFHLTPECIVRRLRAITVTDNHSPSAERFVFDVAEPHIKVAPKLEQHARLSDSPTENHADQIHTGDVQRLLLVNSAGDRVKLPRVFVDGDVRGAGGDNEVKVIEVKNLNAPEQGEQTGPAEVPVGETPVYRLIVEHHITPQLRLPQFFMHSMRPVMNPMMHQFMVTNPYVQWNYMNRHRQAMREWMMQVEQYNRQLQMHNARQTMMQNELPRFMQPPPAPVQQQKQWQADPQQMMQQPVVNTPTNLNIPNAPEVKASVNEVPAPSVPVNGFAVQDVAVQHDAAPVQQDGNEPEPTMSPEQQVSIIQQMMQTQKQVPRVIAQNAPALTNQEVQTSPEPDRDEIFRRLLAISQQMQNGQLDGNNLLFLRTPQDLQAAQAPEQNNVQPPPEQPEKGSDEIYRELLQRSQELQRTQPTGDAQKAPEQNNVQLPTEQPEKGSDEIYRELLQRSQELQRTQPIEDAQKAPEQNNVQLQQEQPEKGSDEIYRELLQRSQELQHTQQLQDAQKAPEQNNVQLQQEQPEKGSDEIYRELLQRSQELQRAQPIEDAQKTLQQDGAQDSIDPAKSANEIYRALLQRSQELQQTQQIERTQKVVKQDDVEQPVQLERNADEIYHDLLDHSQEPQRTQQFQDSEKVSAENTDAPELSPSATDDSVLPQPIVDEPEASPEVIEVPASATDAPVQSMANATERGTADPLNAFFRFFEQETIKANQEQAATTEKESTPESSEIVTNPDEMPEMAADSQAAIDVEPTPAEGAVTEQPNTATEETTAASEQPIVVQEQEGDGEIQLEMNKNWSKDQAPLLEVGERPIVRIE